LGGASNVARNLAKAQQDVSMMSVVGNDEQGKTLKGILEKSNIQTDLLIVDNNRATTIKTRMLGPNNAQMLRLDVEDTTPIPDEISSEMLEMFKANIEKFDIVVISDYRKGLLNVRNTAQLIKIANDHNKKTLIDTKEPSYAKYKDAYLIKPNLQELKTLTKMEVGNDEEVILAANELRSQTGAKYVLATRGKDGMTLVDGKSFLHIGVVSQEVYDVSGAGDTVISYLAVGLANNFEIENAVRIANIASNIEVSKIGTYAVSIDEIKEFINKENDVSYDRKMPSVDELAIILQAERQKNKRIVFTNGCFDIFHVGHSRYLKQASTYGDILVVGVNSDASVKRLKGADRPIISEKERMELLADLQCVSYVVKFEKDTPCELIKKLQPDVITKGGDYKPEEVVGKDIVEARGGKVIICKKVEGKSTTNIITKIKNSR
jgi:D-beta-D-heptose 7-phosphate kinase / D-beta-D-heptose 1-phosphate adenosyltransferase